MACLTKDNRIIFTCSATKKSRKILLGDMRRQDAKVFLTKVEGLIAAANVGRQPDPATLEWARGLAPRLLERLVAHRLIPEATGVRCDLKGFIENFIRVRGKQVGASANNHYRQAQARALEFFAKNPDIRQITLNDAIQFRNWLVDDVGLAENSASKRCATMRIFFAYAVDSDLIAKNPFADRRVRKAITPAAAARRHFLPHEDALKVLAACGDDRQLAAIFSLARWGGLRIGETLLLRWEHVDLKNDRLTVLSPKTAGHGRDRRVMPLFPEVKRALLALPKEHREPADLLVSNYATRTPQWAGKKLEVAIEQAGLKKWVRLWQNLRCTRATEIADKFASHICAAWLGHSEKIADQNYRRATDAHFVAGAAFETGSKTTDAAQPRSDEPSQMSRAA